MSLVDRDREAVCHLVAAVSEPDHQERQREPAAFAARVADPARQPGRELHQPLCLAARRVEHRLHHRRGAVPHPQQVSNAPPAELRGSGGGKRLERHPRHLRRGRADAPGIRRPPAVPAANTSPHGEPPLP